MDERTAELMVELKAAIAPLYQQVGRPYLAANAGAPRGLTVGS